MLISVALFKTPNKLGFITCILLFFICTTKVITPNKVVQNKLSFNFFLKIFNTFKDSL